MRSPAPADSVLQVLCRIVGSGVALVAADGSTPPVMHALALPKSGALPSWLIQYIKVCASCIGCVVMLVAADNPAPPVTHALALPNSSALPSVADAVR